MTAPAESADARALRETRAALVAAEQELAELPELRRRVAGLEDELARVGLDRTRVEARLERAELDALRLRGERAPLQTTVQRQRRLWTSRATRVTQKLVFLLKRTRLAHVIFRG